MNFKPIRRLSSWFSFVYVFATLSRSLAAPEGNEPLPGRFSSNLPIILVTRVGEVPDKSQDRGAATWRIYEPRGEENRARLIDEPERVSRIGIKKRGSSTVGIPKTQFSVDIWDDDHSKRKLSVLGMPADGDWLFYSPYQLDRALFRNAFAYELSERVGRYAPRWRFCELFLNGDYMGVYMLAEKIEAGRHRVDVGDGGFVWKSDRPGPGEKGFMAAGRRFVMVSPKEKDTEPDELAQLIGAINTFDAALGRSNGDYRKFIDVASWVDHWWLNVLPMNKEPFRVSAYMHKSRKGKIKLGPVWDFDRSLGSYDRADDNPEMWYGIGGVDYFKHGWFEKLFRDIDWEQDIIDRWFELRSGAFSLANLLGMIDRYATELSEAQVRHFNAWPEIPPKNGTYRHEVRNVKSWLTKRVAWLDRQYTAPPTIQVEDDALVVLKAAGKGRAYYTLDGSDPRVSGGAVSSRARLYEKPFPVKDPVTLRVREHVRFNEWSGVSEKLIP